MGSRSFRWLVLLGVLFLAAPGVSLAQTGGIEEPGHKGELPLDKDKKPIPPAKKVVDHSNLDCFEIPPSKRILKCGETFEVDAVVKQKVESCESFKDYTPLYDQALAIVDRRINLFLSTVKCPEGDDCHNPYEWYSKWIFTCEGNVAMVKVKKSVKCLNSKGDKIPPYTGNGSDLDKTKPVTEGPGTDEFKSAYNTQYINVDMGTDAAVSLQCPVSTLMSYTYMERGALAEAIKNKAQDYDDVLDRAEASAHSYWDNYTCKKDCNKEYPFQPVYTEWGLQEEDGVDYVVVTEYFWVVCK